MPRSSSTDTPLRYCPDCRAFVRGAVRECPYCGNAIGGGTASFLTKLANYPSLVTWTVIGSCVAIYMLEFALQSALVKSQGGGSGPFSWGGIFAGVTRLMGSNVSSRILKENEWWRLVTACFLHGGLIHVGFNMYALRSLGQFAEMIFGKTRFWVTYFFCGVSGSLASILYNRNVADYSSVGASGAILGILGLLLGFSFRRKGEMPREISRQLTKWLIFILVFGILMPRIDNAGHIGGLLCGMVFGYVLPSARMRRESAARNTAWAFAAGLALLATVVCMGLAGNFCITELQR